MFFYAFKIVQVAVKEVQAIKENKEKEIEDLNTLIDEKTESLRTEYEAKVNAKFYDNNLRHFLNISRR